MKYLLDSHVFLWSLFDSTKLSAKATKILLDKNSTLFVSSISFWEISLKYALGKLGLDEITPEELPAFALKSGIEIYNGIPEDFSSFHNLPIIGHKDPFDRMLVWQAVRNSFSLVSRDRALKDYKSCGLQLVW